MVVVLVVLSFVQLGIALERKDVTMRIAIQVNPVFTNTFAVTVRVKATTVNTNCGNVERKTLTPPNLTP